MGFGAKNIGRKQFSRNKAKDLWEISIEKAGSSSSVDFPNTEIMRADGFEGSSDAAFLWFPNPESYSFSVIYDIQARFINGSNHKIDLYKSLPFTSSANDLIDSITYNGDPDCEAGILKGQSPVFIYSSDLRMLSLKVDGDGQIGSTSCFVKFDVKIIFKATSNNFNLNPQLVPNGYSISVKKKS